MEDPTRSRRHGGGHGSPGDCTLYRCPLQHHPLDVLARSLASTLAPELLTDISQELKANALVVDPDDGKHIIDLGILRDGCPSLSSAFQEVLRVPVQRRAHPRRVRRRVAGQPLPPLRIS